MQAVQCSKGHFYDQSLGQCPQCAEEARRNDATAFDMGPGGVDAVPQTAPATAPATAPIGDESFAPFGGFNVGGTAPVTNAGFAPADFAFGGSSGGWQVDDYAPTQPNAVNGVEGFDPIVGWLICVKGPNRGRDYRLHSGANYVGSSSEMDVCIENDRTISRRRAASISYDDVGEVFFIQRGDGRNLIYLNGTAVRSDADLKPYDHILIGSTELVFVPLCCEKFKWQEE